MQNVRVLSRACMCLISVAASGGASRYLAAERGCRVAAIDLTPNFVEVARVLAARCGLADRIEVRQAMRSLCRSKTAPSIMSGRTLSP